MLGLSSFAQQRDEQFDEVAIEVVAHRLGADERFDRQADARYISHYQQEARLEPAMPTDNLALILRTLGIGLSV